MQKILRGNRYCFKISLSLLNRKQTLFSIEATHNRTKRTAFITNVNVILSGLNVPPEVSKFWESDWVLNKAEADRLMISAKQLFSDKKFLPYLEKYLDLDRQESEWERYERL